MAEYEREFTAEPAYSPVTVTASQPRAGAQSAFVVRDRAPRPAPIAPVYAAPQPAVAIPTAPVPAAAAPAVVQPTAAATVVVGPGRNRKRVMGALRGVGAGILIILIGVGLMLLFSANSNVGAGEVEGSGIVTSLGSASGNSCDPIARFAVDGRSFTANSSARISPCPVGLGETVDVIYSATDPASHARVEMGTSVTQFLWLIPVLGGVLVLVSFVTFIVRAGSLTGGIAVVRDGSNRRKEPAASA